MIFSCNKYGNIRMKPFSDINEVDEINLQTGNEIECKFVFPKELPLIRTIAGYWLLLLGWLDLNVFEIVVKIYRIFWSIFTLIHTRNNSQKTKHHIQETKTAFEKLFKLLLQGKDKLERVTTFWGEKKVDDDLNVWMLKCPPVSWPQVLWKWKYKFFKLLYGFKDGSLPQ